VLSLIGFLVGGAFSRLAFWVASAFAVRLLLAFGIGLATYTGIDLLFGVIDDNVNAYLGALSSTTIQLLDLFGISFGIQLILSAYTAIIAIKGLASFKKVILR